MAVDANTYGTVARVEARVGDLVDARTFGTATVPTLVQVEALLDDTAAQINAVLKRYGYAVPVATGTDPEAFAWLRSANSAGAAALALNTVPGEALDPETPDPIRIRRQGLWAELNAVLKAIREGELPATRTVSSYVSKAYAGSQQDEDGNATEPIFKRQSGSYPGTW